MNAVTTESLPIAVIGAGPVGLAAAAHLVERGLEPILFEAGTEVGASVRSWGHVRVFSPWAFNIDPAAARLLERSGWEAPEADGYPTGDDIVARYLEPLAAVPEIAGRLRLGARVVASPAPPTGSTTECPTCSAPTATATPVGAFWSSAAVTRRSTRSSTWSR